MKTKFELHEVILTFVLAGVIGILFWTWTFVWEILSSFLKATGASYLLVGFWMIGGLIPAFIIRKPGIAFIGEVFTAFVEMLITQWGITALFWGIVQGFAAELVFFIFRYKKWNLTVIIIAGIISTLSSYVLDFFYSKYYLLSSKVIIVQLITAVISGIFLAGILSYLIATALKKTGILNRYAISQDEK